MKDHKREDMFQNTTKQRRQQCFWLSAPKIPQYHSYFCTFPLVVGEDGLVVLHDVGEEESSARLKVRFNATAHVGPEGGFEGEVPWGRDAVVSCGMKKSKDFS